MLKKIKSFYNKENYDISDEFVDPLEYHKTLKLILEAFYVTDEAKRKRPYLNHTVFIFLTELIGAILSAISLYHGIDIFEIPHITEAGTYVIILSYAMLLFLCTKLHVPQYNNLVQAMKEDFNYICTTGSKYRQRFFNNQLETWKITIQSIAFSGCVTVVMDLYIIFSLFFYLATHKPEEKRSRPLIFPFWLKDVNIDASPIYELLFMFTIICTTVCTYNYSFMIQTQIVWVRHIATQADVIIWSIEDLLEDVYPARTEEDKQFYTMLLKKRMREIVMKHQSMYSLVEEYSKTFKKLLMFEQILCGPVACLTAYCVAEKLDEGEFDAILSVLFLSAVILYLIPSYLCTSLAFKVNSVCDACWNTPFWNSVPIIRPYMVLIMQRSSRPLNLHPPGFEDVSMETFSKKMTSAYSLFNVLRQGSRK